MFVALLGPLGPERPRAAFFPSNAHGAGALSVWVYEVKPPLNRENFEFLRTKLHPVAGKALLSDGQRDEPLGGDARREEPVRARDRFDFLDPP